MANAIVIGDGPGGLSAALFLAKRGMTVTVYGQDQTAMHWAMVKNYLGIEQIHGKDFQAIARRQVEHFGARIVAARVESIRAEGGEYEITLEDGARARAKYVILSEGKSPRLALQLGLEHSADKGLATDHNARTRLEGVYAVGRLARPGRSQAIISAGDGAAAAIDILSREHGADVCDWDEP